jgi:hypothetical protein
LRANQHLRGELAHLLSHPSVMPEYFSEYVKF